MHLSFGMDIIDMYRVGKSATNRPLIIKLSKFETKCRVLQHAKNLKGNVKWHGVGITHDLTKIEYAEEKFRESHLRLEAEERNNRLSSDEKMLKFWKVVGGRGKRHLTLHHLPTCNYGSNNNNVNNNNGNNNNNSNNNNGDNNNGNNNNGCVGGDDNGDNSNNSNMIEMKDEKIEEEEVEEVDEEEDGEEEEKKEEVLKIAEKNAVKNSDIQ